ncbi:uncharacterized protein DMENIID0001_165410 [Sergentomyia squamirostris]
MLKFLEISGKTHKFTGFMSIKGNIFTVNITFPEHPSAQNSTLEVFDLLQKVPVSFAPEPEETAHDYCQRLEKYLPQSESIETNIVENILAKFCYLDKVIDELDVLECSGHTIDMTDDFTKIRISGIAGNEKHFLELDVGTEKTQMKVIQHSLPNIPGEMFWKMGTIDSHLATFNALLNQMSDFYENMHTIDELCFVVGPSEITTKTTSRIVKFSEKIFLNIKIDPLISTQVNLSFIGPIVLVEPLRGIYNEKISNWDPEMNVHQNLLRMYDLIYFPMRDNDQETPCNICFDYLNGTSIPIISCDNDKCNVIFHLQCLENYFATLRTSKTMFSLAMGNCPFCRQKLTTFLEFQITEQEERKMNKDEI